MTATWTVRHTNVCVGLSSGSVGGGTVCSLNWGIDPELGSTFPWAGAWFPSFLILGIGFTLQVTAAIQQRRPRIVLNQPGGIGITDFYASGTTASGAIRRYEFGAGFALETPAAGTTTYRECLPDGMVLLGPANPITGNGFLTVELLNAQAGDTVGVVTIIGMLLLP